MPNRKTHPLIRKQLRRSRRKRKSRRPKLRFSPYAWAKLLYLRDYGPTEIGGFGIAQSEDLLCVTDFVLVQQLCTEVTVAFDDDAVADYFDEQIDRGLRPEQIGRIWLHTHPGDSAQQSHVDIETFDRVFGKCDWAIMFIIARDGDVLARLHWRQGGPAEIPLQVEVDYALPFSGSDHDAWEQEYRTFGRLSEQEITFQPTHNILEFVVDGEVVWKHIKTASAPRFWTSREESIEEAIERMLLPNVDFFADAWIPSHVPEPLDLENRRTILKVSKKRA